MQGIYIQTDSPEIQAGTRSFCFFFEKTDKSPKSFYLNRILSRTR